jgi:hypothetical protein
MNSTPTGYERWHNAGGGRRARASALDDGDGRFNAYLTIPSGETVLASTHRSLAFAWSAAEAAVMTRWPHDCGDAGCDERVGHR